MDELIKIFETIDSFDGDENIKDCYKEIVLFELDNIDLVNDNYNEVYEKLINKFMGDL